MEVKTTCFSMVRFGNVLDTEIWYLYLEVRLKMEVQLP